MTTDAWIALGILTIALLFVTEWLRVDVVALHLVIPLVAAMLAQDLPSDGDRP